MFKKVLLTLTVIASLAFTSCGGGKNPFSVDDVTYSMSNPTPVGYLKYNGKSALDGELTIATTTMSNIQSSNPEVATINPGSSMGVVGFLPVEPGVTTISFDVTLKGKTYPVSFEVTVEETMTSAISAAMDTIAVE